MITIDDVSNITELMIKLVNKYNRLDSKALDFGTGDLLYPSEIHMIETIGKNHGNTVNEICQQFGVTKGAVSQIVYKLEKKGLVSKERNTDFYKEIILSLTKKGRIAFEGHEKLHKSMDADLYKTMADFNKHDLNNFEIILRVIESRIEKYIEVGKKDILNRISI
ncbi:MarR family transcriptional regulator [Candidatus Peregrinibacteria bacterium]|nr:MarR family transcriptional regulator [Candidatus Peregrinibacteria bacterium]